MPIEEEAPREESRYNMALLEALLEIRNAVLTLAVMVERLPNDSFSSVSPIEFFLNLTVDGVSPLDAAINNLEIG